VVKKYLIGFVFFRGSLSPQQAKFKDKVLYYSKLFYKKVLIFSNRILIPIKNFNKNPICFIARSVTLKKNYPKYLIVFCKKLISKKNVFLSDLASGFKRLSVVLISEGPFDLFRFIKLGLSNVLSFLGTSLNINLLEKFSYIFANIIFIFDYDFAGIEVSYKAVLCSIYLNKNFKFLSLNVRGLDPDLIVNKFNSNGAKC
jgi:DNA primase